MNADAVAAPKPEGGKKLGGIVGILLPALLAGAAAFGGAKFGGKGGAPAAPHSAEEEHVKAPGPTVGLQPFVLKVPDADQKQHALRITLAVELKEGGGAEEFNIFVPRVRDAILSYLRTLTVEELDTPGFQDTLREELLLRVHKLGAEKAAQLLITDMVTQ